MNKVVFCFFNPHVHTTHPLKPGVPPVFDTASLFSMVGAGSKVIDDP